jgi:hypothetical protein
MSWLAKNASNMPLEMTAQKEQEYDKAKAEGLPVVEKEAEGGVKPFDSVKFQPVRSPGIFEAEFGVKGKDLIFHFWPDGYHKSDRNEHTTPAFKRDFLQHLTKVMGDVFNKERILIEEDRDMGAFFIKAHGWGESDSFRELSIKACEKFHSAMGGEPG